MVADAPDLVTLPSDSVCVGQASYRPPGVSPVEVPCQGANTCVGGACTGRCIVPDVLVVVDRSTSVTDWLAVSNGLSGFFDEEASAINFGLRVAPALHAGCAVAPLIPIGMANGAALKAGLVAPTVDAKGTLGASLTDLANAFGNPRDGQFVLLVTSDGNGCGGGDPVADAKALRAGGIRTAVINVGSSTGGILDDIAAAGGVGPVTVAGDAPTFQAALASFATATRRCLCEPDSKACLAGDMFRTCSTDGLAQTIVQCAADADPCTRDVCDPVKGCNPLDTTLTCDDANACTTADSCTTGTCQGTPVSCLMPPKPTCTSTNVLRTFASPGTCATGGSCDYAFGDTTCARSCLPSSTVVDAECSKWVPMSTTGAPSARTAAAAVWTGSKMFVFGGISGTTDLGDGGFYDPASDSWQPLATTNAPSARSGMSVVWTGTEAIVWGGGYSPSLNTGARYNPTTNTWTATSTTNAPAARAGHYAVWTGTEMLVWGGTGASIGGRYDPAMDKWIAMSTTSQPTALSEGFAAWTGSEMVVWGGCYFSTCNLREGGRYSPALDQWKALSTVGAPADRVFQVAVWTGTEMINSGGSASAGPLKSGAAYEPSSDTWTAISPLPVILSDRSAVWTGSQMLLLGFDGLSPTGLSYTRPTDSWRYLSLEAGVGRIANSTIWTGTEMIIWAGAVLGASIVNTGWRYRP